MANLAFIQNINPTELLLIAVVAVLVFGRRLPQVAGQTMAHVQRARRAFNDLRRETGIDDEIREARRTFEQASYEARLDPNAPKIHPPSGGSVDRGVQARSDGPGAWPADEGDVAGPSGDLAESDGDASAADEDSTKRDPA